ncbi:type II secretion system protein [bacterium]|nr:type II secretion system protein [bacterium]
MAQFTYKARKRSGELVQGILDVADRSTALLQIERMGLFPIMVDGGRAGSAAAGPKTGERAGASSNLMPAVIRGFLQRKRRPKLRELATFTQQLANLLNSGMPLTVALNSMTHLESKGIPSEVSRQLKQDVMEGKSLSDSMGRQDHIFGDMYINMIRAGEQSGALVDVLRRLANHYERFAEVQSKFTSAMVYPAFVATVGVVIIIFFMSYMLPKFMSIFDGMNVPLPMTTLMLKHASEWFSSYWWTLILAAIAIGVIFVRFKASTTGRRKVDQWKMSLPVFGKVVRLNLFGQFARTLSTLLHNGVPVLTALKITEEIVPNAIVKEAIAQTREDVTDGKTIAQPLARSKIFPQLMIDLLKIGEETGDVPGALGNIADTYESELTIALQVMTNLIEPVLIIVMALGVGFLLFSILSAMFAITSSIGST